MTASLNFLSGTSAAKRSRDASPATNSESSEAQATAVGQNEADSSTTERSTLPPTQQELQALPAFLRKTKQEIQDQFIELDWEQKHRMLKSRLDNSPDQEWMMPEDSNVVLRNRYLNVQPWKNKRIKLKVPEGHNDYINASPISLVGKQSQVERKFIATQGPKDGQANHFWRMVWQETDSVAVIVMLTQLAEAGKDKCSQYFPPDLDNAIFTINDNEEFGDNFQAVVKLQEIFDDSLTRSTVRKLLLTVGKETKEVWHLLFSAWADFGVPEGDDRNALLELIKLSESQNASNPRIVHCSAGVGRTGTFIALDYLLNEMNDGALDNITDKVDVIYDTVSKLREQRMMMVQSLPQMQFIYDTMKEKMLSRKASEPRPADIIQQEQAPKQDQRINKMPKLENSPTDEIASSFGDEAGNSKLTS